MSTSVGVFYWRDSHSSHLGNLFTVLCRPRVSRFDLFLNTNNKSFNMASSVQQTGNVFFICVNDGTRKGRNLHDNLRTNSVCPNAHSGFLKKSKRAY